MLALFTMLTLLGTSLMILIMLPVLTLSMKVRRTGPCHCAGSTAYSRSFHLLPRDTHCPRSHQCFHAYKSAISKFQKRPTNTPLGNPWQWKSKYGTHQFELREVLRTEALGSIDT